MTRERRWLNAVASQSEAARGLLLQSSLKLVKLAASLKLLVRSKLIDFEREAKSSRVRSVTRRWSRRASMAIAKAASRSVAFKAARIRESIMEDQDELIARRSDGEEEEVDSEANSDSEAALEDAGHSADLRVADKEDNAQS